MPRKLWRVEPPIGSAAVPVKAVTATSLYLSLSRIRWWRIADLPTPPEPVMKMFSQYAVVTTWDRSVGMMEKGACPKGRFPFLSF